MTELETLQRAKMYLDQLSVGVNPLDGSAVPAGDVVCQARLVRCFRYVSGVLGQVIDSGGTEAPAKRAKKRPYQVPLARRAAFQFSDVPLAASELARRLTALGEDDMRGLSYRALTAWLVETGLLAVVHSEGGGGHKRPTAAGLEMGISVEERTGAKGPYRVVVYHRAAQQFILDNLDAIISAEENRRGQLKRPWDREQDDLLIQLRRDGASLQEIADRMYRTPAVVRRRLEGLGLTPP